MFYLNSDALANGRVWLFGLDTNLLQHNTLGVRGTTKGIGLNNLQFRKVSLFVKRDFIDIRISLS